MLHANVITWKCFLSYWPFVGGIHWSPVDSPHKGAVMQTFDVFLDVSPIKLSNKHWWCQQLKTAKLIEAEWHISYMRQQTNHHWFRLWLVAWSAIISTNAGILSIGPLGTNFNEVLIKIHTFSFKKIHWKMSSGKWRPFCLGLNVLTSMWHYFNDKQYRELVLK